LLTASGAALAVFAALAAADHAWKETFLLLGAALLVDAIDGPLARAVKVAIILPSINGVLLDLVVDYGTYVFVPALILAWGPVLPPPLNVAAAAMVAIVGAIYFADTRMKTDGLAFRGFPAVWNAVVFQLMVYRLPGIANAAILTLCAVLTFVPVEFVHPVRVVRWRIPTLVLAVVWAALALVCLADNFAPPTAVTLALAAVSLYFALVGLAQQGTRAFSN
jgi:phosphatidylcholine synthase